ncbi:hypothetical protein A3K64_01360 [Candidatus Micrarchaeota archaeon RBG_16_36_9]|nr:MAG: hypothetical protein A3K64_01360 [Candidatus Micrarchaeota archaeon RBG_16_36_9]
MAVGNAPNTDDRPRIIGTVVLGCKPGNSPIAIPKTIPIASERNTNSIIDKRNSSEIMLFYYCQK